MTRQEGGCHCGAVRFAVDAPGEQDEPARTACATAPIAAAVPEHLPSAGPRWRARPFTC